MFLDFLKRLVKDNRGRNVRLILDGHPAHRARIVARLGRRQPTSRSSCTPARLRPELKPAECLNQDVKTNALDKRRPLNVTELKADVRRFLRSCQPRPAKAARYFHKRHVSYAAG